LTFELSAQNPSNPIDETNPAKSTNPMGGALSIKVEQIQSTDTHVWDAYVRSHSRSTVYHLYGWKNVIEKTYGHRTYYLIATRRLRHQATRQFQGRRLPQTSEWTGRLGPY
jgi:hypothetical protein